MEPITPELFQALRAVADGCSQWIEHDPRIARLDELELVRWAGHRPRYEDDHQSGPAWEVTTAGRAYLAGYEHGFNIGVRPGGDY